MVIGQKYIARILSLMLLSIFVISCGPIARKHTKEERRDSKPKKIKAEAFLYDVIIHRQGKKTSLRFEVYLTDSIAGLSARGYLGKGALKGWLTKDSIAVYFPTVDEYAYDAVSALFAGKDCSEASTEVVDFLSVFSSYPSGIHISPDTAGIPIFKISDPDCPWYLSLEYDHRKVGPRLKKFEFDDGKGNSFSGKRRKFKPNKKIPEARFKLAIPASSRRITL